MNPFANPINLKQANNRYADLRKRMLGKANASPLVLQKSPKARTAGKMKTEQPTSRFRSSTHGNILCKPLDLSTKLKMKEDPRTPSKERTKRNQFFGPSKTPSNNMPKNTDKMKSIDRIRPMLNALKNVTPHCEYKKPFVVPVTIATTKVMSGHKIGVYQNSPSVRAERVNSGRKLFNSLNKRFVPLKKVQLFDKSEPKPKTAWQKRLREPRGSSMVSSFIITRNCPSPAKAQTIFSGPLMKPNTDSFVMKPKGEDESSEMRNSAVIGDTSNLPKHPAMDTGDDCKVGNAALLDH